MAAKLAESVEARMQERISEIEPTLQQFFRLAPPWR